MLSSAISKSTGAVKYSISSVVSKSTEIIRNERWINENYKSTFIDCENHKNTHSSKIPFEIASKIRKKYKTGTTQKNLAKEYGISNGQIKMKGGKIIITPYQNVR